MYKVLSAKDRIIASRRLSPLRHIWRPMLIASGILLLILFTVVVALFWRANRTSRELANFSMPYVQTFDDGTLTGWRVQSGLWYIRNQALAQTTNLEKPTQIFIPYMLDIAQSYHLSVYMTLAKNARAVGISFNSQNAEPIVQMQQVYVVRVPTESVQNLKPEGALSVNRIDETGHVVPRVSLAGDLSNEQGDSAAAGLDDTGESIELVPQNISTESPNQQQGGTMALLAGYTDSLGSFVPQVRVPFAVDTGNYRLDVYVLNKTYTIQLNGQTLVERRPLFYTGGLIGFYARGRVTFDTLKLTAAGEGKPGEMIYVSDFDQRFGGMGWVPFSGKWTLTDKGLVQTDPDEEQGGIGYEGGSFENYVLQATFYHSTGTGGGLLFNMPSPYQLNGAVMVRYSDQSDSLFWGYFDEKGVFTRQGFTKVAGPSNTPHQLKVFSHQDRYTIYLDEQPIVQDVAAQRVNGYIGLVTARSSVVYTIVEAFPLFSGTPLAEVQATTSVTPNASELSATATPVVLPLLTTSGLGITEATPEPVQSTAPLPRTPRVVLPTVTPDLDSVDTSAHDDVDSYVVDSGVYATAYRIEAEISLPVDNPRNGLILHMPERGVRQGSFLISLSPAGDELFWGDYDQSETFHQRAAVALPQNDQGFYHVVLVVDNQHLAISVGGQLLASDILLPRRNGWIGLLTDGGPKTFRNLRITVEITQ